MQQVNYYLAGRLILESMEQHPPRVNDERCIGGKHYRAARVVTHLPDCPPDHVNAHLEMVEAEAVYPAGYP